LFGYSPKIMFTLSEHPNSKICQLLQYSTSLSCHLMLSQFKNNLASSFYHQTSSFEHMRFEIQKKIFFETP